LFSDFRLYLRRKRDQASVRRKIVRIQHNIIKLGDQYDIDLRAARDKPGSERAEAERYAYFEYSSERDVYDIDLRQLQLRLLSLQADELDFPINYSSIEREDNKGIEIPTEEAIYKLRLAVRTEVEQRRSALLQWSTALIGIVGALTGLVAVFRN